MGYGGSVYILTNKRHTVLYIGVTSDLYGRIRQHREKFYPTSFTARYHCFKLVYYENFPRIEEAIVKEKQLKKWNRDWKVALINRVNPDWQDLFESIEKTWF